LAFEVKMQGFMHFYSEKLLAARSRGAYSSSLGGKLRGGENFAGGSIALKPPSIRILVLSQVYHNQ